MTDMGASATARARKKVAVTCPQPEDPVLCSHLVQPGPPPQHSGTLHHGVKRAADLDVGDQLGVLAHLSNAGCRSVALSSRHGCSPAPAGRRPISPRPPRPGRGQQRHQPTLLTHPCLEALAESLPGGNSARIGKSSPSGGDDAVP